MEVLLKLDGKIEKRVAVGTPFSDIVASLKNKQDVLAVCVNGQMKDLSATVSEDANVELLTFDSDRGKDVYRHSSAHLMAQAVKEIYPSARMTIGPTIEDGFYYDFDFERPFVPEDLEKIEARVGQIIKRNLPIQRIELSREEAIKLFTERDEPYKAELIGDIKAPPISIYRQGEFIDLCTGPHVPSTGRIKAFKILGSAGAYWRGDEKNKMLQRIYGTSFSKMEDLNAHLEKLEEIKRRDHRRLGKALDLFSTSDEIGAGLVLWHPNGAIIRKTMEDFWREAHLKSGYALVYSPHVAKLDLWKQSGHLEFYKENMYSPMEVDGCPYEIKPMNCPFHIVIYKSHLRSYRDLPLRFAELGTVYRYERSGALHGLLRVRGFTQDDAHIFCRPEQMASEILSVLDFTTYVLGTFGFHQYDIYLSTRPEAYVGTLELWEQATSALGSALQQKGLTYKVDPGEGVFYGPKIDVKIKDTLGRAWQCATIQVDFNLPERFGISYRGKDGGEQPPVMIHRALLGSLERFLGVLIEHYGGAFPLWLSPVQAEIIPITERQQAYARKIWQQCQSANLRASVDDRNERMNLKIREAQMMKVPYLFVVGDREVETETVSVRTRSGESVTMALSDILRKVQAENEQRCVVS